MPAGATRPALVLGTGTAILSWRQAQAAAIKVAAVPIGFDGEGFLVGLERDKRDIATLPDGREYAARFAFASAADTLLLIGPVPVWLVTQALR